MNITSIQLRLNISRGNMIMGGINTPAILTAQSTVNVLRFSALVILPTCFCPFTEIILPDLEQLCALVIPVSSTFQIRDASKWALVYSCFRISKKRPIWIRLNPTARAKLVGSGVQKTFCPVSSSRSFSFVNVIAYVVSFCKIKCQTPLIFRVSPNKCCCIVTQYSTEFPSNLASTTGVNRPREPGIIMGVARSNKMHGERAERKSVIVLSYFIRPSSLMFTFENRFFVFFRYNFFNSLTTNTR